MYSGNAKYYPQGETKLDCWDAATMRCCNDEIQAAGAEESLSLVYDAYYEDPS